jgi:hypothetical protein
MTQPAHTTPGEATAAYLIAAKAEGKTFTKTQLAAIIDICIQEWQQKHQQTTTDAVTDWIVSPEDIYQSYPRKIGKTAAIKAIKAILKTYPALSLLTHTKTFSESVKTWPEREKQFIPHPATWFNRGSYMDDPKEWQRDHPSSFNATARDYSKI